MKEDKVKAIDVAEKYGLFLKIVTSVRSFDNYNSMYNIYFEEDGYCRRVAVLTPYEELEEVNDEKPSDSIITDRLIDGNLWIEEYPLIKNPAKIDMKDIVVSESLVKQLFSKK